MKVTKSGITYISVEPGKYTVCLNPRLVEKQGLTQHDVDMLFDLHRTVNGVKQKISIAAKTGDKEKRNSFLKELEYLEFDMQEVWKFPLDSSYHTHWLDIDGCSCPSMDNHDMLGVAWRVINRDCPIHGE